MDPIVSVTSTKTLPSTNSHHEKKIPVKYQKSLVNLSLHLFKNEAFKKLKRNREFCIGNSRAAVGA